MLEPPPDGQNKLETHNGYVALLDILGYQSFLESHRIPENATHEALGFLQAMKDTVRSKALEFLAMPGNIAGEQLASIEWLVFSDTILLTMPIEEELPSDEKASSLIVLIFVVALLQRQMFDYGLPVRGAVTSGPFLTTGSCFAGKPIVDAYELASQLDLATFVIAEETCVEHSEHDIYPFESFGFITRYLTPLKGNIEKECSIIFPAVFTGVTDHSWSDADIKQLVVEAFWKHRKQFGGNEMSKVTNTELLLRFLKMRLGNSFR